MAKKYGCSEETTILFIVRQYAKGLTEIFKKALKKKELAVKIEKLKNKKIASVITISEESRRMQDMMKMYAMPGMDPAMFGGNGGETLTLNANHPLVQFVMEQNQSEDASKTTMICEQLYDLAALQNKSFNAEEMSRFVQRSNDIMLLLTK